MTIEEAYGWEKKEHYFLETSLTKYISQKLTGVSVQEAALLNFILGRTIQFKKLTERITVKQFSEGVYTRQGELVIRGTGFSKPTILKHIKVLIEKGLIQKKESVINSVSHVYYSLTDKLMKIPKRLQNKGKEGVKKIDRGGKEILPKLKENKLKDNSNNINLVSPNGSTEKTEEVKDNVGEEETIESLNKFMEESLAKSRKHSEEKHKRRMKEFKKDGKLSLTTLTRQWERLSNEYYSSENKLSYSKGQMYGLLTYARAWNKNNIGVCFLTDYLPFLFSNWSIIMNRSFRSLAEDKKNSIPTMPCVGYVAKAGNLRVKLEQAFHNKEDIEQWGSSTPLERKAKDLQKHKGLDSDTALELAKKNLADKGEIKDMDKRRKQLKQEEAAAERKKNLLDRELAAKNARLRKLDKQEARRRRMGLHDNKQEEKEEQTKVDNSNSNYSIPNLSYEPQSEEEEQERYRQFQERQKQQPKKKGFFDE